VAVESNERQNNLSFVYIACICEFIIEDTHTYTYMYMYISYRSGGDTKGGVMNNSTMKTYNHAKSNMTTMPLCNK
jgi:hypothetical protein